MELLNSVLAGAVGAAIVALIGNIVMFKLNRKATKEDRADERADKQKAKAEADLIKRIEHQEQETEILYEGVKSLLHDRLYHICKLYLQRGEITITELENVDYIYRAYHRMGGNSTGTELYERIKELPVSRTEGGLIV